MGRSLLAMLTNKVPAEEVDLHDHIDRVLTMIRVGNDTNRRLLEEPPTTAEPSESSWWPAAKSSARSPTTTPGPQGQVPFQCRNTSKWSTRRGAVPNAAIPVNAADLLQFFCR